MNNNYHLNYLVVNNLVVNLAVNNCYNIFFSRPKLTNKMYRSNNNNSATPEKVKLVYPAPRNSPNNVIIYQGQSTPLPKAKITSDQRRRS